MKDNRKCLHCGKNIPPQKQSGTKYCNDSCKARYHEKKLLKELLAPAVKGTNDMALKKNSSLQGPGANILPGLEGVAMKTVRLGLPSGSGPGAKTPENAVLYGVTDQKLQKPESPALPMQEPPEPEFIPVTVQVETELYKSVRKEYEKFYNEWLRLSAMIKACDEQIEEIKINESGTLPLGSAAIGGIVTYNIINKNFWAALAGAAAGYSTGKLVDALFLEKERKKQARESIAKIEQKKKEWIERREKMAGAMTRAENLLSKITRYETKTKMRPNLRWYLKAFAFGEGSNNADSNKAKLLPGILEGLKDKAQEKEKENTDFTLGNTVNNGETQNAELTPDVETSERIITSKALKEIVYPVILFQGRWREFFGEPSTTFHCVVHGKPGGGKSTFCIQFAYYLARHHGNTIYISGEEGFSKTLQQKIILTGADHPRLFFTDLKSFEEIKSEIKEGRFHFIFIDSLDTLRIDAAKVKELKALHPSSALITISQSTKAGGARGSNEILHDADIEVMVHKGFAITNKNRFNETEKQFSVFQTFKKKDDKSPPTSHSGIA